MAKLIIKRTSEWSNRYRKIGIYLDGEKIGVIDNGKFQEFEVEPGEHVLETKIDWCRSKPLTLKFIESEARKIELSGSNYGKWLTPIYLLISIVYFTFGEQLKFKPLIFISLIILLGLYPAYHLTLGRNKYLRLKEL